MYNNMKTRIYHAFKLNLVVLPLFAESIVAPASKAASALFPCDLIRTRTLFAFSDGSLRKAKLSAAGSGCCCNSRFS